MEAKVMNTEAIPLFISEKFHTSKVSVQEHERGIILVPIDEATVVKPLFDYGSIFGCMKGKMQGADEHDWFEPLEDFKEYM